uniref:Bulb-type lectin domain-containing protein n=1 Tax=Periophthalmus magnuspinnatus TaxID=409849 RepID=A0A3B4AVI9_9GOBI
MCYLSIRLHYITIRQRHSFHLALILSQVIELTTFRSRVPDPVFPAPPPQNDSNLVVYRRGHGAVWATGTVDSSAVRLVLQSDGNLVMFDSYKRVVWQS